MRMRCRHRARTGFVALTRGVGIRGDAHVYLVAVAHANFAAGKESISGSCNIDENPVRGWVRVCQLGGVFKVATEIILVVRQLEKVVILVPMEIKNVARGRGYAYGACTRLVEVDVHHGHLFARSDTAARGRHHFRLL